MTSAEDPSDVPTHVGFRRDHPHGADAGIDRDASSGSSAPNPLTAGLRSSVPGGARVELPPDDGTDGATEGPRYQAGDVIAKGGMGEVRLARDRNVGRTVALKIMLEEAATDPELRLRFMTEARVQGQLEHPAIVPVYDVGRDAAGRAFFTMKRIVGVGLDQIISGLRRGEREVRAEYTVRRLLSIFQQVCLAIDYAHRKGVIHRDIKPSNLMVGGFGEVYVLDWGVAKLDDEPRTDGNALALSGDFGLDITSADHVLGTVGYMAPEQLENSGDIDARADVYALGAVLFELLALEPLNGVGTAVERAEATLAGGDARPSQRPLGVELPPELDAICVRATAPRPDARYATARALHDDIARYLDGDRDTMLRTRLADEHLERAVEAAALAEAPGAEAAEHRRTALRRAARALALDPENGHATGLVARLLLEPPLTPPPEVVAERAQFAHDEAARTLNFGAATIVGFMGVATLLFWVGVRSWAAIGWMGAPLFLAVLVAWYARVREPANLTPFNVAMAGLICLTIGWSSTVAGPLWLPPLYAMVFVAIVAVTHGLGRARIAIVGMTAVAITLPAALELLGVLGPAYEVVDGDVLVRANAVDFDPVRARVALMLNSLGSIALLAAILFRFSSEDVSNRNRLHLMVWHLRQLAPQREEGRESEWPPAATDDKAPGDN